MTRNDTATRRVTTGIVLAVGLFAGGDSYAHIFDLAREHGQNLTSAALLPLAGDGVVAAASAVLLVASRQGRDVPLRARVLLLAGIAATAGQPCLRTLLRGHSRPAVHLARGRLRGVHGAADLISARIQHGPPEMNDGFRSACGRFLAWFGHPRVVVVEHRRAVVGGAAVLLASVTELPEQRGSAGHDGIAGVRTQTRTLVPGPA
jgi:Protein of unknown function (DUF2637)